MRSFEIVRTSTDTLTSHSGLALVGRGIARTSLARDLDAIALRQAGQRHKALPLVRVSSAGTKAIGIAVVGIAASFVGSVYFVFRRFNRPIIEQAARFAGLYAIIALAHAGILFVWTDVLGEDYPSRRAFSSY